MTRTWAMGRRVVLSVVCTLGAGALAGCIQPPKDDVVTIRSALTGDFQESGGQVVMEAEHFTGNVPQGGHSWASENDANAAGGQAMRSMPDNAANVNTGYVTGSPRLDFRVLFATTGTYQVWVRGRAGGSAVGDSDSMHCRDRRRRDRQRRPHQRLHRKLRLAAHHHGRHERDAVGVVDRRPHHQPVDARGRLRRRQGAADDERGVHTDRHGTGREPARGLGHGRRWHRRRRGRGWQRRGRGGGGGTGGGGGGTLPYLDPSLPVATRVADLLGRMTLDEKIGQMTQSEQQTSSPAQVTSLFIGSVLSGADSSLPSPTAAAWADLIDSYQTGALATRLHIPMIYGIDAVHGHAKVIGATVFPHNIGLGATRDPALVQQTGAITAQELTATGVQWTFAPGVSVARDQRWGRAYESFGEDPALVTSMTTAISGLQGGASACPTRCSRPPSTSSATAAPCRHRQQPGRHADRSRRRSDDRCRTARDSPRALHQRDHARRRVGDGVVQQRQRPEDARQPVPVTTVLKGELGFSGFVISDWQAIDQLTGTFADKVRVSVNAGVDMFMMPDSYASFITTLRDEVNAGRVTQSRIDDAVRRILTKKFELGLFEAPIGEPQRRGADRLGRRTATSPARRCASRWCCSRTPAASCRCRRRRPCA